MVISPCKSREAPVIWALDPAPDYVPHLVDLAGVGLRTVMVRGPKYGIKRCYIPWFLEPSMSWAFSPECRILVFMLSSGLLMFRLSGVYCMKGLMVK